MAALVRLVELLVGAVAVSSGGCGAAVAVLVGFVAHGAYAALLRELFGVVLELAFPKGLPSFLAQSSISFPFQLNFKTSYSLGFSFVCLHGQRLRGGHESLVWTHLAHVAWKGDLVRTWVVSRHLVSYQRVAEEGRR